MANQSTSIDIKKLLPKAMVITFALGATVLLGLLSLGGMYALYPSIPLALSSFIFSIGIEGEIYLQNIKGAWSSLWQKNRLEYTLGSQFLRELKTYPDTSDKDCPQFFIDYERFLHQLKAFEHKKLSAADNRRKQLIEEELRQLEAWFSLQLFGKIRHATASKYATDLQKWLAENQQHEWQNKLKARTLKDRITKLFSISAGIFMGLGSTFLIAELFAIVPFFATLPYLWPAIILTVAVGVAHSLLTYNTITELIDNDTLGQWYRELRKRFQQKLTPHTVFMALMTVFLLSMSVLLTICTGGTWFTIATKSRSIFNWVGKLPAAIMGIVNSLILGFSALFFSIQNSINSVSEIDKPIANIFNWLQTQVNKIFSSKERQPVLKSPSHKQKKPTLLDRENWLQIANIPRILIKLTVAPLRILFFLGHLISMAMTADQMPGVPVIISAIIAIICEGFEDGSYFFGNEHEHEQNKESPSTLTLVKKHLNQESGHDHENNIPSRIIKWLASPLYYLAAKWDYKASQLNTNASRGRPVLTYDQARNKQYGIQEIKEEPVDTLDSEEPTAWHQEYAITALKNQQEKLQKTWFHSDLATNKSKQLGKLIDQIHSNPDKPLIDLLEESKQDRLYNQHRFFGENVLEPGNLTSTRKCIEEVKNFVTLGG